MVKVSVIFRHLFHFQSLTKVLLSVKSSQILLIVKSSVFIEVKFQCLLNFLTSVKSSFSRCQSFAFNHARSSHCQMFCCQLSQVFVNAKVFVVSQSKLLSLSKFLSSFCRCLQSSFITLQKFVVSKVKFYSMSKVSLPVMSEC